MFTFAILQIKFSEVWRYALNERATWYIIIWQLMVLPLMAALLLRPLLSDYFYLLAVVSLCTGAITATTALTRMLGLNDSLSLVVGLFGTILMPIPLYLFLNAGVAIDATVEMSVYFNRILVFIVAPFVLVAALRAVINERIDERLRGYMPAAVLVLSLIHISEPTRPY